jgi:hypothetical protein
MVRKSSRKPFALSLSKGCPSFDAGQGQGQGFDKLSPNGVVWLRAKGRGQTTRINKIMREAMAKEEGK